MTYVVALTGGIGSGKSAAADLFSRLGAGIVDTDAIAHALTAPGGAAMPEIRRCFGEEVVAADGRLDRARMRALAFASPETRRLLEQILHPMIRDRARGEIAASSAPYVMLVVPLLVETGAYREVADRIAVVDCSREAQVERTMRRSQLTREAVLAILDAQATREQRLAIADDVIDNDGEPAALEPQARRLHECYLAAARATP
jgi:dephospho-CoA kinase